MGVRPEGIAFAHVGELVIALWRDSGGDPGRVAQFRRAMSEAAKQSPEGFVALSVILPTSDPPDGDGRVLLKAGFEAQGRALRACAHVLIGDSIRVGLGRTFLRGLFLIGRQRDQHLVCTTISEALVQLQLRATSRLDRAGALSSLDAMCTTLGVPFLPRTTGG